MRYVEPFYREVNDNERFGEVLIPFLGGALLGGLFAPAKQVPVYVPSYPSYNYGGYYPMYSNYPYGVPLYSNSQNGYMQNYPYMRMKRMPYPYRMF